MQLLCAHVVSAPRFYQKKMVETQYDFQDLCAQL